MEPVLEFIVARREKRKEQQHLLVPAWAWELDRRPERGWDRHRSSRVGDAAERR